MRQQLRPQTAANASRNKLGDLMATNAYSWIVLGRLAAAGCMFCLAVGLPLYVLRRTSLGRTKALLCVAFFGIGLPILSFVLLLFVLALRNVPLGAPLLAGLPVVSFCAAAVGIVVSRAKIDWRGPLFAGRKRPRIFKEQGIWIAGQDRVLLAAIQKLAAVCPSRLTDEELAAVRAALDAAIGKSDGNPGNPPANPISPEFSGGANSVDAKM